MSEPVRDDGNSLEWRARLLYALVAATVVVSLTFLLGSSYVPKPFKPPPQVELVLPEVPPPRPVVAVPAELERAIEAMEEGRLLEARGSLDALEDILRDGEAAQHDYETHEQASALAEILRSLRAEAVGEQLERALTRQDASTVGRVLAGLRAEEERKLVAARGSRTLSESRALWRLFEEARRASTRAQPHEALLAARRLADRFPIAASRSGFEARAIVAAERMVRELLDAGRIEEAKRRIARFETLLPGRNIGQSEVAQIEERERRDRDFQELVAEIESHGARGKPHVGLEALEGIERTSVTAQRLQQVEDTLRMLLEDLDRETPRLTLPQLEQVSYRKKEPLTFEIRADDDYEVVELDVRMRIGHGNVTPAPLVETAPGVYTVHLVPERHGGQDVALWGRVSDRSGNELRVGSQEQPLVLRAQKRRFLDRFRRRSSG